MHSLGVIMDFLIDLCSFMEIFGNFQIYQPSVSKNGAPSRKINEIQKNFQIMNQNKITHHISREDPGFEISPRTLHLYHFQYPL